MGPEQRAIRFVLKFTTPFAGTRCTVRNMGGWRARSTHVRIYYIDCGPARFHRTKEDALAAALLAARANDTTVTVELLDMPVGTFVDIADGDIGEGEIVATVGPSFGVGEEN
jgi:hypothetical protein